MDMVVAVPVERKGIKPNGIFTQIEQANLVVSLAEYGMTHGYSALFETVTLAFERYERESREMER